METTATKPKTTYTPGKTCGRCGGSGWYSIGRCFRCGGRGINPKQAGPRMLLLSDEEAQRLSAIGPFLKDVRRNGRRALIRGTGPMVEATAILRTGVSL